MGYWKTTVLVSIAMFLAVAGLALGEPAASDLLRESGVSGGVVVHVGCGDGRLSEAETSVHQPDLYHNGTELATPQPS